MAIGSPHGSVSAGVEGIDRRRGRGELWGDRRRIDRGGWNLFLGGGIDRRRVRPVALRGTGSAGGIGERVCARRLRHGLESSRRDPFLGGRRGHGLIGCRGIGREGIGGRRLYPFTGGGILVEDIWQRASVGGIGDRIDRRR